MSTTKKDKLPRIPPVTIENAVLRYKNFSGSAKTYNAKGLRNFHVVLPNDLATMLERDGWNVRWHEPNEDRGEEAWASLKIAVRFDNYPPRIVLITKNGKSVLDEESVDLLDSAEIKTVDLQISPSRWENNGKNGIKAYLSKMFVTLSEDDLELKYSDVGTARRHADEDAD
jgi:hypothetical protein